MKRREFIEKAGVIGTGIGLAPKMALNSSKSVLNVGFIGCGLRGQGHISLVLQRDDCRIVSLADPDPIMMERTQKLISTKLDYIPKTYSSGERDYIKMLDREDLDLVIIATPWRWHTEMAVACLERSIYTGLEVSGGISIDECWQTVRAEQASDKHLYFLENVCFRRDVMAVLNMVRQGLFGELMHLECGYQHDLRNVKFNNGKQPYGGGVEFGENGFSEARWRTVHSVNRNGDLYPTHGIGPVAQYININKGNRFLYLTSVASKSRGLHNYILDHEKGGPDHPNAQIEFKLGDKITTMITCANGETVVLHHDTNLPRPYSLGFRVQGTRGLWMDVNKSVYVEGRSDSHRWESQAAYMEEYDHILWRRYEDSAKGAGHGGMDYFLLNSLIEHAKINARPPFDAIDAATWKAITPLSEASVASEGSPQEFPDFSEGQWKSSKNDFAYGSEY